MNGGLLMVLAKEWWSTGTVNDGVNRSDGRGRVTSKYSFDERSRLEGVRDLVKRSGKEEGETG